MKVCGPQGWEFDLQWRPKGGEIDIRKPENVKFPVGCPAPPSWGKPLIGALISNNLWLFRLRLMHGARGMFGTKTQMEQTHPIPWNFLEQDSDVLFP